jgi:hypothetical protein
MKTRSRHGPAQPVAIHVIPHMHFLDVLVTSISQLFGSLFPSANERQTEIAVRIALVIIILLLLFTPIYIFFR